MGTWQPKLFGVSNFIAARALGISLKRFWCLSSRFLIQQSVNNQVLKKNKLQLCNSKTMIIDFFKHFELDCRYCSRNIQNESLL